MRKPVWGIRPGPTQIGLEISDLESRGIVLSIYVQHADAADLCLYMSRVVSKPTFCICENKDADQLCGNREADQRLCFRYIDSTIPLSKS